MPLNNLATAGLEEGKKQCIVVGSTPERMSQYVNSLRPLPLEFHLFANQAMLLSSKMGKQPDLVILDVVGKKQGLHNELAGLLEKIERRSAVVFAVVDGNQRLAAAEALALGLSDYVQYPFADVELLSRARMHLGADENQVFDAEIQAVVETISTHEGRVILRNSLWQLKNNLNVLRTVSDLALTVGCSEKALNAVFLEAFACSAFDYMRRTRMERARHLLARTRIPIIQIASDLAYSSAANFSTAFKTVVGVNPRAYRQAQQRAEKEQNGD